MLTTDVPRPAAVACSDCDKPAFRRQMFSVHPEYPRAHGHLFSYDSHSECLTDDGHHAALKRADGFFEAMHKIEHDLFVLLDGNATVPVEVGTQKMVGTITRIDFIQLRPSACGVRTHVLPEVTIKAFGLDGVFVLSGERGACNSPPPHMQPEDIARVYRGYPLEGLTAEVLLDQAKQASKVPFLLLRQKFQMGDHRHGLPAIPAPQINEGSKA